MRSKADGEQQPLTDEQRGVKEFLVSDEIGMWSNRAEKLARSGATLEAAQIAWAEVQASDREVKPHALYVRLTEDREGYERRAEEKREEARVAAERERRKPELDRNKANVNIAWNTLRERDRSMVQLLVPRGAFALSEVHGCSDWFYRKVAGGSTPLGAWVRGPRQRERALLRELRSGAAPREAVSQIERAYWRVAPRDVAEALQAWHAATAMPQAAG